MTNKSELREYKSRIYANDDLTLLRARLAKALQHHQGVISVNKINGKVVVYQANFSKIVFDSLFELFEWDAEFVYSVCQSILPFCWALLFTP